MACTHTDSLQQARWARDASQMGGSPAVHGAPHSVQSSIGARCVPGTDLHWMSGIAKLQRLGHSLTANVGPLDGDRVLQDDCRAVRGPAGRHVGRLPVEVDVERPSWGDWYVRHRRGEVHSLAQGKLGAAGRQVMQVEAVCVP